MGDIGEVEKNELRQHMHAIIGRETPENHLNKPLACLETEYAVRHRKGDIYIVTYPKTGTTLMQYICHLLRIHCGGANRADQTEKIMYTPDFEDIHQVCPHTSSAWFLNQDLNAPQPGCLRLFKSHRRLQEIYMHNPPEHVKYITTIRRPLDTLQSLYHFRRARGVESRTISEYAASKEWMAGSNTSNYRKSVFDHIALAYLARGASNLLVVPYEDLVQNKDRYVQLIAQFMGLRFADSSPKEYPFDRLFPLGVEGVVDHVTSPLSFADTIAAITHLTSKEAMSAHSSKFDESWCSAQRFKWGREKAKGERDEKLALDAETKRSFAGDAKEEDCRAHKDVCKINLHRGEEQLSIDALALQDRLWDERVVQVIQHEEGGNVVKTYDDIVRAISGMYFGK